jgi:hypothetical protein
MPAARLLALALLLSARALANPDTDAADAGSDDETGPADARASAPKQPAEEAWHLDLTVHDVGIALGDPKHVDGLRLNFRDLGPSVVHGLNVSVWSPPDEVDSDVTGIAVGLPVAAAGSLHGLLLGGGVMANKDLDGIGVGPLGVGSGGAMRGLFLGGLGAGCGESISGLAIGGLGVGAGGDLTGVMLGGLGAGSGGKVTGLAIGGLGVGAGSDLTGVMLGGLGAGSGGNVTGLALGGLGVGAGGDMVGMVAGGLGVGAGGSIEGLALAVLGVGAPRIRGVTLSLAAGGADLAGLFIAPAFLDITPEGSLAGLSISAFNWVRGEQHGVVIGIFNYAASLHGVQIGVLNWAGNNPAGLKLLPLVNAHFG